MQPFKMIFLKFEISRLETHLQKQIAEANAKVCSTSNPSF
jgi:hypothetical protein